MKLYKYYSVTGDNLVALINRQFWASKPRSFNDPYDTPVRWMELQYGMKLITQRRPGNTTEKPMIPHDIDIVGSEPLTKPYSDKDIEDIENLGIICFSSKNDEMLMWSHYADQHKGYVLEFEIDEEHANFLTKKNMLLKVSYEIRHSVPHSFFGGSKAPGYKHPDWRYESEYRYILSEGDKLYSWSSIGHNEMYPFNNLTGIIFGTRASESSIKAISSLVQNINQDIHIMKANLNDGGFGLSISTLSAQ